MSATVVDLHPAAIRPVATILAERRQHVAALKACDDELKRAWERAASDLEEASSAIVETDLPVGLREEARQLAADLPDRIQRAQKTSGAK